MRKTLAGLALATALGAGAIAAQPASAATLGTAGPLTYVKATTTVGPSSGVAVSADHSATCPRGKVMAGGGAQLNGAATRSFLVANSDSPTARQWFAEAWHFTSPRTKLNVYGICDKASRLSEDTEITLVAAAPSSGTGNVACPEGHLVSGGVRTIGDADDWRLNAGFPIDEADDDEAPDDAWLGYAYHSEGGSSSMLTDVTCRSGKLPTYRQKAVNPGIEETVRIIARCPRGTAVIGGGAFLSGAISAGWFTASRPWDSKDRGKVPEDGWTVTIRNETAAAAEARSHAVCI